MTVMFTAAITGTIVSIAVPTIVADLHGLATFSFVVAGAVMPRVTTGRHDRLDPIGSLLMVSGLISLLLGFT